MKKLAITIFFLISASSFASCEDSVTNVYEKVEQYSSFSCFNDEAQVQVLATKIPGTSEYELSINKTDAIRVKLETLELYPALYIFGGKRNKKYLRIGQKTSDFQTFTEVEGSLLVGNKEVPVCCMHFEI